MFFIHLIILVRTSIYLINLTKVYLYFIFPNCITFKNNFTANIRRIVKYYRKIEICLYYLF